MADFPKCNAKLSIPLAIDEAVKAAVNAKPLPKKPRRFRTMKATKS